MKYMNKFIALGLGITFTFAGSNLAYGYFSHMVRQQNTIEFKTNPVVLGINTNDRQYITFEGNEVIKFKGMLKHNSNIAFRDLYPGEKISLEITPDSDKMFKGASISYYITDKEQQSGYIEMVKKSFYQLGDWDVIGDKRTVGIKASIIGLDGKTRNAWQNNKNIRYFSIELRGYTTSNIDPGKINIVEVERMGNYIDYEKEESEENNMETIQKPDVKPEDIEPPKEETEVPSEPEIVEPPKEEVEVPSEPEIVEPPKVEIPQQPGIIDQPIEN